MNNQPPNDCPEPHFGIDFNRRAQWRTSTPPSWANKRQGEKWAQPGIVLWEGHTETVTQLSATQALQILDYLLENDDWRQGEIKIGEPCTKIWLDEPDQEPEPALADEIYLQPEMTRALFETLQRHQPDLVEMKQAEAEKRSRILAEVYEIILSASWGSENQAPEPLPQEPPVAE